MEVQLVTGSSSQYFMRAASSLRRRADCDVLRLKGYSAYVEGSGWRLLHSTHVDCEARSTSSSSFSSSDVAAQRSSTTSCLKLCGVDGGC